MLARFENETVETLAFKRLRVVTTKAIGSTNGATLSGALYEGEKTLIRLNSP